MNETYERNINIMKTDVAPVIFSALNFTVYLFHYFVQQNVDFHFLFSIFLHFYSTHDCFSNINND